MFAVSEAQTSDAGSMQSFPKSIQRFKTLEGKRAQALVRNLAKINCQM